MVTVTAHRLESLDPVEILEELTEDIDFFLDKAIGQRPRNVATLYSLAWNSTQLSIHLNKSRKEIMQFAGLAVEAAVGLFELAYGSTNRVSLRGKTISYSEAGPNDHAHAETWLRATSLGLLIRNQEALRFFIQIPAEQVASSVTRVADFRVSLVTALQSVMKDEDRLESYRLLYQQVAADDSDTGYESIIITFIDGLLAITKRDVDAFNAAIVEHLQAHHGYWSSKRWANNPEGLVCITGSALVDLAASRGIGISVESEYLWRLVG
jgi:hypothetical protein